MTVTRTDEIAIYFKVKIMLQTAHVHATKWTKDASQKKQKQQQQKMEIVFGVEKLVNASIFDRIKMLESHYTPLWSGDNFNARNKSNALTNSIKQLYSRVAWIFHR